MMSGRKECNCSVKEYQKQFCEILNEMICEMTCAQCNNSISHNMIVQMIPHHQGAIRMSQNALRFSICPELIPILKSIIVSQRVEIQKMEYVLQHLC